MSGETLIWPRQILKLLPDYNVIINGKAHKDLIWWYKYPTAESALIAGHICFYNEKVDIYIDGEKEDR